LVALFKLEIMLEMSCALWKQRLEIDCAWLKDKPLVANEFFLMALDTVSETEKFRLKIELKFG
jgi:hypothetical protein